MIMFLCDDQGDPGPLPPLGERPDRLGLRVPLHRDEPMFGYLARFAARAGHPTIKSCLSQSLPGGFSWRDLINGRRQEDVSALFDLPRAAFEAATPHRAVAKSWAIGGESRLPRGFVAYDVVRVCPLCLAADEAFGGGVGPRRVEPHVRTFWLMPLVAACPTYGLRLIEVAGGLERFAHLARNDRRPAWDAVPTQAASAAETNLARLVAGHLGFVAPLALAGATALLAAAGLPAIVDLAALIGFGLTGEPDDPASDEAWREWIGLGLSLLLTMPLMDLVRTIAARLPQLRRALGQAAEPVLPGLIDVEPMTTLRALRHMLPRPPAHLAFVHASGVGEVGDRAAPTLCPDASNEPLIVGDRTIDAFLRPRGATAQSLRLTMADQLPARLTRPGGAKLVAPAKLLLEYSPDV